MFGWSLIQSFRIAVRGTETTEIDCRCSKQLWQMNVPCVNIWKVNKVNKSVQRVRKNSWIKDFGGAWTGHCRILTILETAIIIIHCIWLLYFITQTRRQSTMCCSVHLTPTWEGCRAFFFGLFICCLVYLAETARFLNGILGAQVLFLGVIQKQTWKGFVTV